jgi:2,4-dienoyl-CoA reductase-like NADH-dependent reductase (Old Yellow Enzyme family)
MSFARLFEPGGIGTMTVANRLCMAPLGTRYAGDDGCVTGRQIDFYAERARGGVGLVIVEATYIHPYRGRMLASDDRHVRGLARLADAIHEEGARACIQVQTRRGRSDAVDPVAPSPVAHPVTGRVPRALTQAGIEAIVDDFARAALRAKQAGFDGVQIHGASGYLLNEFLSPLANRRDDAYGGSLGNRARFALEIVRRVKDLAGTGFAVLYRQCASERVTGGISVEEAVAFARMLEGAGVDAIDVVSGSTVHSPEWIVAPPPSSNVPLASAIRRAVGIPVIVGGGLDDPAAAAAVLAAGQADFVALGKALIADPEWARKVRDGRVAGIRPCVRCMLCTDPRVRDSTGVRCAVNPRAGRDAVYPIRATLRARRIAIVGGGLAGMQAAVVLAERGHEVALFEKEPTLGGRCRDTASWAALVDYFERRLADLCVAVHVRHAATVNSEVLGAEAIVIAARGSTALADALRARGRVVHALHEHPEPHARILDAFETAIAID